MGYLLQTSSQEDQTTLAKVKVRRCLHYSESSESHSHAGRWFRTSILTYLDVALVAPLTPFGKSFRLSDSVVLIAVSTHWSSALMC